jgi:hypothetical protein
MPDWSVKIVPAGTGGGAAFVPDLKGAHPGDPLKAWQDDLVTWKNTTGETHQIELVDIVWEGGPSTPVFETKPIPAAGSSRPSYDVAQPDAKASSWSVHYRCKLHPQEQGTIDATGYPAS